MSLQTNVLQITVFIHNSSHNAYNKTTTKSAPSLKLCEYHWHCRVTTTSRRQSDGVPIIKPSGDHYWLEILLDQPHDYNNYTSRSKACYPVVNDSPPDTPRPFHKNVWNVMKYTFWEMKFMSAAPRILRKLHIIQKETAWLVGSPSK